MSNFTRSLPILLLTAVSSPAEEQSPWELTAAGALSAADGNSESVAYNLQLLASYIKDANRAYFGVDYFYAENGGSKSTDSLKLYEELSRDISEDWFLSQYGSALKDQVAGIDYRADISALLGYRILDGERARLSLQAGPGYAWEQGADGSEDFMTARLAQRFEYKLNDDWKIWQSFGWTPRVEEFSNSLIEFDAGIETRLNSVMALRTFLRHRIDTEAASGKSKEDTALMLGLSYDLGGVKVPEIKKATTSRRSLMSSAGGGATPKIKGWETTAALGMSLNKGNSDQQGAKVEWDTEYFSDERDFVWELDYHFTEDSGETSTDRLSSRVQNNFYLDGPNYLGLATGLLKDELADIDYRLTPSVLAGRALIKNERTRLALEAGPTLTFEQTGNGSSSYTSATVAERFKHRINDRVSLKQSVVGMAEFEDPENYTLVGHVAIDTKLNDQLLWRCALESRYENLPVDGRDHHDLLLTSSVAVKF